MNTVFKYFDEHLPKGGSMDKKKYNFNIEFRWIKDKSEYRLQSLKDRIENTESG